MSEVDEKILIKFAQKLAGNEKKYRDLAFKKLRKWIVAKSHASNGGMSKAEHIKIWKGLHYCMWMSDKPLVQEELAASISSLIQCFQKPQYAFRFIDAFFETECREWFGIDRLRLDKFMMLIRLMLRQSLVLLNEHKWKQGHIRRLLEILQRSILSSGTKDVVPDGIRFHLADIYLSELDKHKLSVDKLQMFLEPYCVLLTKMKSGGLYDHITKRIFMELIDWEVETRAIRERNEDLDEDEEAEEVPNHIQVDYAQLSNKLFELASEKKCIAKNRTPIYDLVKQLRDLSEGILPSLLSPDGANEEPITDQDVGRAAHDLMMFELKLLKNQTGAARKKNLKKLKRKRAAKLAESEDEPSSKKQKHITLNGDSYSDKQNGHKKEMIIQDKSKKSPKKKLQNKREPLAPNVNEEKTIKKVKRKSIDNESMYEEAAEVQSETNTPKSQKKKNKKRLSLPLELAPKVQNEEDMETEEVLEFSSGINEEEMMANKADRKLKKAKRRSVAEQNDQVEVLMSKPVETSELLSTENVFTKLETKKQKGKNKKKAIKSLGNESDLFPGGFDESDEESVPKSANKKKKVTNPADAIISMKKITKTPPAFVRKAFIKAKGARTEPKKPSAKMVSNASSDLSLSDGKKKVIFDMKKNQAQDFQASLMVSPVLPFNPKLKPDVGILRSPSMDSPTMFSPKMKLFKKRTKASDFF